MVAALPRHAICGCDAAPNARAALWSTDVIDEKSQPVGRVLVVDDEEVMRTLLRNVLVSFGYEVSIACTGDDALGRLADAQFDIMLTDLRMPGLSGLKLLAEVRRLRLETAVVVMTAYGTVETAVEAMKNGAADFITKPLNMDELQILLDRILVQKKMRSELEGLRAFADQRESFGELIGASPAMRGVYRLIERVAGTDTSVVIEGETGTGKELVARAIHLNGVRRGRTFMGINCSALSETLLESELFGHEAGSFTGATGRKVGLIERVNGGTLFLDEITEASPAMQAKLLRVLQEREVIRVGGTDPVKVDLRLIVATNRNLQDEVRKGAFREDLYYRISIVVLRLPPLRERIADVPILAGHFLKGFVSTNKKAVNEISLDVIARLTRYAWPGNVRELQNVIESAAVLDGDGVIGVEDLPEKLREGGTQAELRGSPFAAGSTFEQVREAAEKDYVVRLLIEVAGNVSEAARRADLGRATFHEKLRKYGIDPEGFRRKS
jgi:DNA-binding NtrC family response regulator